MQRCLEPGSYERGVGGLRCPRRSPEAWAVETPGAAGAAASVQPPGVPPGWTQPASLPPLILPVCRAQRGRRGPLHHTDVSVRGLRSEPAHVFVRCGGRGQRHPDPGGHPGLTLGSTGHSHTQHRFSGRSHMLSRAIWKPVLDSPLKASSEHFLSKLKVFFRLKSVAC